MTVLVQRSSAINQEQASSSSAALEGPAPDEEEQAQQSRQDNKELDGAASRQEERSSSLSFLNEKGDNLVKDDDIANENNSINLKNDYDDDARLPLVVNEWAQGTSIHGVANVTDGETWKAWKRLAWLTLTCASAGLMIWQFEALITQYRSYKVLTDTETITPRSLPFPQVTLCSTNPLSQQKLNILGIDEPTTTLEFQQTSWDYSELIFGPEFNGLSVGNTNHDQQQNHNTSRWTERWTDFGRCWSFDTSLRIVRPGMAAGLQVIGLLYQDDFFQVPNNNSETTTAISEVAGMLVFIQSPGTLLSDQVPYVTASPGHNTLIRIHPTLVERERQAPWARCFSEAPAYTQAKCRTQCWHAAQRHACGCKTWGDPTTAGNLPFCRQDELDKCRQEKLWNETAILDHCGVPYRDVKKTNGDDKNRRSTIIGGDCSLPPCSETIYDMSVSQMTLSNALLAQLERQLPQPTFTQQYIKDNLVWIQVNYDKIQFEKLTESKEMSFAQLLAAVGGSMGLFLGISLLSVVELFGDLCLLRILPRYFGYRSLYGLGSKKPSSHMT